MKCVYIQEIFIRKAAAALQSSNELIPHWVLTSLEMSESRRGRYWSKVFRM